MAAVLYTVYGPPLTRRSLTRPFPRIASCGRNGRADTSRREFGGLPDEKTDLCQRRPARLDGYAADRGRGRRLRSPASGGRPSGDGGALHLERLLLRRPCGRRLGQQERDRQPVQLL